MKPGGSAKVSLGRVRTGQVAIDCLNNRSSVAGMAAVECAEAQRLGPHVFIGNAVSADDLNAEFTTEFFDLIEADCLQIGNDEAGPFATDGGSKIIDRVYHMHGAKYVVQGIGKCLRRLLVVVRQYYIH